MQLKSTGYLIQQQHTINPPLAPKVVNGETTD
jgi:hypothetical protein